MNDPTVIVMGIVPKVSMRCPVTDWVFRNCFVTGFFRRLGTCMRKSSLMMEMSDQVSSKARRGVPSMRIEANGLGGAGAIVGEGWEESQEECMALIGATDGKVVREGPVSLTTSSFPGF